MLALVLALTALAPTAAQLFPTCPNYQSTSEFTQAYVDQMRREEGGYIVRLSNGDDVPCQRIIFHDGNDFNYTFIDVTGAEQSYSDRYSISLRSLLQPSKLELNLPVRTLGSDPLSGVLTLVPLLATPDVLVMASCRAFGVSINEQVLVFSPYTKQSTTSNLEIMTVLREKGIPKVDALENISTNCTAVAPEDATPLALAIFNNFMDRLQLPFSGARNNATEQAAVASTSTVVSNSTAEQSAEALSSLVEQSVAAQNSSTQEAAAERNTPQEVADQVLRLFSSVGISPAQIMAARNQVVEIDAVENKTATEQVVAAESEQNHSVEVETTTYAAVTSE